MRLLHYVLSFLVAVLILSCEKDETTTAFTPSVDQYMPNILNEEVVSPDKSSIFLLAQGEADNASTTFRLSSTASIFARSRQPANVSQFTINGVPFTNSEDADGNVLPGRYSEDFIPNFGDNQNKYEALSEVFQGRPVELYLATEEMGKVIEQVTSPILMGVSFENNTFGTFRGERVMYGGEGIKITWDAPTQEEKSNFPNEEMMVGIVVRYDSYATARDYPDEEFPDEDMVYTIITENDGEHTIDFSNVANFPSGGVHVVTIGNGLTYSFRFDESDNIIYMYTGNIVTGTIILTGGCEDEEGNLIIDCDCGTVGC